MWCILVLSVAAYLHLVVSWGRPVDGPHRLLQARIHDLRELTLYGWEAYEEDDWLREAHALVDLNEYEMPPEQVVLVHERQLQRDETTYWRNRWTECVFNLPEE
jgi:hypothetical protein